MAVLLFIAASPKSLLRLEQAEELRSIENAIDAGKYGAWLAVVSRGAARHEDWVRLVSREQPDIVHFSGHCDRDGHLLLAADDGSFTRVSPALLARSFVTLSGNVRLVVLSGCQTLTTGRAIESIIDNVVVTTGNLEDRAAIAFAGPFYRAVASGVSIQRAFDEAKLTLEADLPEQAAFLRLLEREAGLAEKTRLLAEQIQPSRSSSDVPHELSELPTEAIPEPAPLLPQSRMPLAVNPQFVGRQAELRTLAESINARGAEAIGQVVAVTGMGGIGKTQLASAFVHRYGPYFPGGVFWLSFADPASIPAEIASCGGPGHLALWPADAAPGLTTQVELVRAAWREGTARLLVIDNCEDESLLKIWRTTSGGCRVLLTSRRRRWSTNVTTLALDVLDRPGSIALLRTFRSDLSAGDAALHAIADELGDLPLALHVAGSFLRRYRARWSPGEYLAQLRERALLDHPSLAGHGSEHSPTEHELHVGRTFALSLERLDRENATDAAARDLLARAACFAPGEPIPRRLLSPSANGEADELEAELEIEDALARMVDLGLLDMPEDNAYVLHRLLAVFASQALRDAMATARGAVECTVADEAKRINLIGYPALLLEWQPHLRYITDRAALRDDAYAAFLCNQLGFHLREIGHYWEAKPYCERALAIEETLRPDGPSMATCLGNLALVLQDMGEHGSARALQERALDISETHLGSEHPDTATSLDILASLLKDMGELAAARPLCERALASSRR
ncbi:MAG: tetratricopeptide repeat protein [Proteobacteria bacterium]|nr:tetratricopeptide repeat protein [Pseudomonadota bacterium]